MALSIILWVLPFILTSPFSSSSSVDTLTKGSSLSVNNTNAVLTSPNLVFSAGFFPVGNNAFCFAIWFNDPSCYSNCSVVWMANRDRPVNGQLSKFSFLKSGNLVITDADKVTVWTSNTFSSSSVKLRMLDNGNLVLSNEEDSSVLWQSFDFPTDTLLPQQELYKDRQLVCSRSRSNFSSGFYKLYFDNDNVLRLLYNGPDTSSIYWPNPELLSWEAGRSTYNSSRIASFNSLGNFSSTDDFTFMSTDYGMSIQRRLKIDFDGNVRMYSRGGGGDEWEVSWEAMFQPCRIHGICGSNSICNYNPSSGRTCSCIPGFKIKDQTDWSLGCEPEFNLSCNTSKNGFLELNHVEFFGYDYGFYPNYTLDMCKNLCDQICGCKGFQFKFIKHNYPSNIPYCFPKTQLLNGHLSPNFEGDLYIKVPKASLVSHQRFEDFKLDCSNKVVQQQLNMKYAVGHHSETVKFVIWFASAVGVIEMVGILLVWRFLVITHPNSAASKQDYLPISTGGLFRRFNYAELKKATQGFKEVIGRGAGGTVYKGIVPNYGVAAIKELINEANQGEAEFRAEISTIGKLNHINLIEMWGYCAEGKHRLLVYKYMERGSLAENLYSNALDWEKRFNIAVGTAKGLAYLHEECLEWVLHCDVKPQNILLDHNYQPKVSDFGLSRLLKRDSHEHSNFSKIRGTRGYIAPEWVFNLPITSKVDVYSYGMVMLEVVTGMSPTAEGTNKRVVRWVRENMNGGGGGGGAVESSWVKKIVDPKLEGRYEKGKLETLVKVALKCVNEDKDARPSMRQVVEMLVSAS